MKARPLGFLTSSALVASLITILAVAAGFMIQGGSLFSAGGLLAKTGQARGGVSSHAQLANNCAACHTAPWDKTSMAQRCLACHTEVADQLKQPGSLHAVLLAKDPTPTCKGCHTEHKGAVASITFIDTTTFPHDATGYSLLAHQLNQGKPFTCADCHPQGTSTFDIQTCSTCHSQVDAAFMQKHTAAYGSACLACHDGRDSYGLAFDHSKVSFPLVGKHASLDCTICHSSEHTIAEMKQTPADCFSCHSKDDIHAGKFGTNCAACHTAVTWARAAFDHNTLTAFPLTGAHTTAACLSCHANNIFKGTPSNCVACHNQNDSHNGALGSQCAQCHTTAAWSQITFDHATTAFPLTGGHAALKCESCHQKGVLKGTPTKCADCHLKDDAHQGGLGQDCASCHVTDAWTKVTFNHAATAFPLIGAHLTLTCQSCHHNGVLKGTPTTCFACHQKDDKHQGTFGQDCALCHATTAWKPSTFDHSKTLFPLTGAHITIDCVKCHANGQFAGTHTNCSDCHAEPAVHQGIFGLNCNACHTTSAWSPASFDHATTGFALSGAHGKLSCATCHTNGTFGALPSQCVACHAEPAIHKGQFGTNCSSCHSTSTWSGATFDHSTTGFALTGAHHAVSCTTCHANGSFGVLPTQCVACHAEPAVHKGQFGTDCATCHSTSAWLPATFDHSKVGFALSGAHTKLSCSSCHPNGQFSGAPTTCVGCHPEPAVHQGQFGTDCASCHSTTAWLPASFDHSKTPFPLTGAHVSVACASCHPNNVFKGTPTACSACHAEPAIHKGLFGTDCASCHSTTAWLPASYNGPHTFPMSHGGANGNCQTCHPNGLTGYTCYQCHAGIKNDTRHKAFANLDNCVACHPTGGGGG